MSKPIRVVLVDDHRLVRQGLRSILEPDPDFEVVGEAANGADALRIVAEQQPDVVLLDLKLPDMSGIELCQRLIQLNPEMAVLVLTAFIDRHLVNACLQAGARGYLLKDAEHLHLREQLLSVVAGHAALDPRAADVLAEYVRRHEQPAEILHLREVEILRLIAQGLTSKEIGVQLHLSENTVKGYVKDILPKLGAHNRVEAILRAKERGLI
ncbi:MAG: response regulator transcription factor [Anaerolineales bacterium]|nr:response regulator transcription factor [Anaerolineales bacterium]